MVFFERAYNPRDAESDAELDGCAEQRVKTLAYGRERENSSDVIVMLPVKYAGIGDGERRSYLLVQGASPSALTSVPCAEVNQQNEVGLRVGIKSYK